MKKQREKRKHIIIEIILIILIVLYIISMLYLLLFQKYWGRAELQLEGHAHYNLIPFTEIKRFFIYREKVGFAAAFLNLGGNVIGFIPFGILLPAAFPPLRRASVVIVLGALFSGIIEFSQLMMHVGVCDVDDVILNAIGAAVGYIIYKIARAASKH